MIIDTRTATTRSCVFGFCLLLMMFMPASPLRAQTGVDGRNVSSVAIGQGGAPLGEYRQSAPGQWVETNASGEVTFNFVETQRDDWSVYLLDQSRAVNLQIDLHRRKVIYSDANSPRFDLYDVLSATATPVATAAPAATATPPASPEPPPAASRQREFPETYHTPLQGRVDPVPAGDRSGYYAIAHMTNTRNAVNWALQQGANGLEIDINFSDSGTPEKFNHGWPCDCTCLTGVLGVCDYLGYPPCAASTGAAELLGHIATKSGVALVVIDSKVGGLEGSALEAGGTQIIELLDRELYARGYRGDAIIGIGDRDNLSYLNAAAIAALESSNREHYYFSIDQEGDDIDATLQALKTLVTNRRVYGTGLSACSTSQYHETIKQGAAKESAGIIGLTYTWTIDTKSSMKSYLDEGARGIITNYPGTLVQLLQSRGNKLVTPGSRIPISTSAD